MTSARLAYFCSLAKQDAKLAARAMLRDKETTEADARLVLQAVNILTPASVDDFERNGLRARMKDTAVGSFWLAAESCKRAMLPPLPRISPRQLVLLSTGLRAALEEQ